jgi:hypothetical protein
MEDELRKLERLRSTLEPGSAEQVEVILRLNDLKAHLKQPLSPLEK